MGRSAKVRHRCGGYVVLPSGERVRCLKRKSLRRRIEHYQRPPRCPQCGSREHWYVEEHRQQRRDATVRNPCRCRAAAWFPHRPGSLAGCVSAPRYGSRGTTDMMETVRERA